MGRVNPPDYAYPVKPGDEVILQKKNTFIHSRVVNTEGYFPDVVELENRVVVDLVGWDLKVVQSPRVQSNPPEPG
jgi:hypothetical protein